MKKIVKSILLAVILPSMAIIVNAKATNSISEDATTSDSVMSDDCENADSVVIASWIEVGDTIVYDITDTSWSLTDADTILVSEATARIKFVVTDSTDSGYKLDCTFMSMTPGEGNDSELTKLNNAATEFMANKIVDTTIKIETDEFGGLKAFPNATEVETKIMSVLKEFTDSISNSPLAAELKRVGVSLDKISGIINPQQVTASFLKSISIVFTNFGNVFPVGDFTTHEPATDTSYENKSSVNVWIDAETGYPCIKTDIDNILPASDVRSMLDNLINKISDSEIAGELQQSVDISDIQGGMLNYFSRFEYLPFSWPVYIERSETITYGKIGRATQSVYELISITDGHPAETTNR